MSDKKMHNQAETLAGIHVELPLHQRQLKAQLMARHSRKHVSQSWFVSTFLNPLKEYITMQKKTKIASFAGVTTMAIVAGFAIVSLVNPAPVSAAQAQLKEAKAAMQQLSPQEAAALKQRVDANLAKHLDEGLKAKDARIITGEEFQKTTGLNSEVKLPGMKIASYVAFTNDSGEKIIIAVNSDKQPVLLLTNSGKAWTGPSQEQMQ